MALFEKFILCCFAIILLGNFIESVFPKRSGFKEHFGAFIIPQPDSNDGSNVAGHHGLPPHFLELRSIAKIKDRRKREAILEERVKRVPRSPQFPINFRNRDSNSDQDSKEEKAATISEELNLAANTASISGNVGINRDPKIINSDVNTDVKVSGDTVKLDAGIDDSLNAGLGIKLGTGNLAPKVGVNLSDASGAIDAKASGVDGTASTKIKLDIDPGTIPTVARDVIVGTNTKLSDLLNAKASNDTKKLELDVEAPQIKTGVDKFLSKIPKIASGRDLAAAVDENIPKVKIGGLLSSLVRNDSESTTSTTSSSIEPPKPKLSTESSKSLDDKTEEIQESDPKEIIGEPLLIEESEASEDEELSDPQLEQLEETESSTDAVDIQGNNSSYYDVLPDIISGELLLPPNYEILQIPKPRLGPGLEIPLIAQLSILMLGINEIDELEGSITFTADFKVSWIDGVIYNLEEAVKHPAPTVKQILKADKVLHPSFLKKLWRPDIYMEGLVAVNQPSITHSSVISLNFNKLTGFISYKVRLIVKVNCPFEFHYYPADTQKCEFRISSYTYSNKDMSLDWEIFDRNSTGVILEDDNEDNYDIRLEKIGKINYRPARNNFNGLVYEVLTFTIAARRKISYHLIQTYLPSVFNIFVTWLVFLIPYSLYDCRIGTTMTTLLTLTAMFSSVREQSPQVTYIKAIDLWMLACVLFIFLNLVELTVMTWMRVAIETYEESIIKRQELLNDLKEVGPSLIKVKKDIETIDAESETTPFKIQEFRKIYNFFNHYSFRIFAIMFLTFTVGYWSWLFVASEYFSWVDSSEAN